jgi:hypothetical protein
MVDGMPFMNFPDFFSFELNKNKKEEEEENPSRR